MKKFITFMLIIFILITTVFFYFNIKNPPDLLSKLHYLDFSIVVRNKELNSNEIEKDSEKLIKETLPYINQENRENFILRLKENLGKSIENEWKKILDNKINAFYVSDSFDTDYFKSKLGADNNFLFDSNQRFVIVKATSYGDAKYVYFYPYKWDESSKHFTLDIENMIFSKRIADTLFSLIKMGKLEDINWYKINVN